MRSRIILAVAVTLAASSPVATPVAAQVATPPVAAPADSVALSVFRRAQRLVNDGQGTEGRALVDSMLNSAEPRTAAEAEALYWRAMLAESWDMAQRDYLRIMIEHERHPRAGDAMLRLAQGELMRGDRDAAVRYLERLAREAPESPARAEAGLWHGRILVERGEGNAGCALLRNTRALVPPGALELENQYTYLLQACPEPSAVVGAAPPTPPQSTPPVAPGAAPPTGASPVTTPPAVPTPPVTQSTTPPVAPATAPATAPVTAPVSGPTWTVQVAALRTRPEADALVERLKARGYEARVDGTAAPFRVRFGQIPEHVGGGRGDERLQDAGEGRRLRGRGPAGVSKESSTATPLMTQYREIKARHPGAILFFRMGDFYEMFYEDAEVASRALDLTLTSRNNGGAAEVPLAGVPVKAASEYVRRLVQQGFRVAICEQIEDPKLAKGIVRRAVIETVTPGAAFSDDLLDTSRNNYLCALLVQGDELGIAAADLSTGELRLVRCAVRDADAVLARLAPREALLPESQASIAGLDGALAGALVTPRAAWEFEPALATDALAQHFAVQSLEGFGIGASDAVAVGAAGALFRYLRELQPAGLPHLARPTIERPGGTMPLDEMTRRNLELVESLRTTDDTSGTLLAVLDRTATPMGARLLRQWILAPLVETGAIHARLDAVTALFTEALARGALREAFDGVRDIERLAGRTAAGRATPRDLRALGDSLARLPEVGAALRRAGRSGLLGGISDGWDDASEVSAEIQRTIVARPPLAFGDGETIAPGLSAPLDELRAIATGGKDAIAALQAEERARTGISSLKVGYNRVFGYYIEVTNSHKNSIPSDYQRRQTLTGAERYITPALKEFEEKVLHATERIEALERELFEALRARVGAQISRLQGIATRLAQLDVLASLAEVAAREGYVRPEVDDGDALVIVGGRHPVVERMMPRDQFIPNDVTLDPSARMIILTGPNMAGKSTILRQIGLLVLMAQMGSYVPASSARVGIADRVFTRVGASDNLVRGQSTFMVEMSETSAILHTATSRSLVLLDEIGRGTATWDGLSIAWAVSEHLHERVECKTVFATHYHELTQLADELSAVRNFNVAVKEVGERILFLHRLKPGGADRSYGIEVGRLAGLPAPVIARARALLRVLESEQLVPALGGTEPTPPGPMRRGTTNVSPAQLGLFAPATPHPVVERLRKIDPDSLTPRQALDLLSELRDASQE